MADSLKIAEEKGRKARTEDGKAHSLKIVEEKGRKARTEDGKAHSLRHFAVSVSLEDSLTDTSKAPPPSKREA